MASHKTDKRSIYTSNEDRSLKANKKLCSPPEGEDIVISGMAGQFPDSGDVYHFRDNLFNKVDLVSGDYRRWRPIHPEVPQRSGKLLEIAKFDTGFFGVCQRHVNNTDPMCRLLLERTFETIMDAGYHPSELAGTNTGVFVGACFAESEKVNLYCKQIEHGHSLLGSTRSMLAHQISYFFKLSGPSYITDTACSSSMVALENAYRYISEGRCESAIVAGAALCLHPIVSLQFARLGVLSADGNCKVFDNAADGYARSEGISAIFLQKSKDARRIYAHIIHSKTNCDGFKQQGITYPSSEMQKILMKEIYHECDVDPSKMSYVEAHGTGTRVGDPEELNSLDDVFCTEREKPLHIGAIKSNIGHNEPASGISAIVKVLIGMECGFIPPNRNFTKPREGVLGFEKGRLKVVADKMPWPDNNGLVGINSFGFGGSNGHVVMCWNRKEKVRCGLPEDNLPRLVCVSGRNEQAVYVVLDDLKSRKLDAEYVKLLHTIFRKEIVNHHYRGFSIISKSGELHRSVKYLGIDKQKVTWVFTNFDKVWPKLGRHLLILPIFARTLDKINKVLLQEININIAQLLANFNEKDVMSQILGTMAIQICLVDVLNALGLIPDSVVGFGTGELIAAYSDDFLSLDVIILAFLYVGFAYCKGKDKKCFYGKELLSNLKHIIPKQRKFQKWLPLYHKNRTNEFYKQGSPEYFVENIISPITFEEGRESLSKESTVLEIGPKIKTTESQTILSLIEDGLGEPVVNLLTILGSLYEIGVDMQLDKLYPEVSWPVSRGTPMVSPLIKWEYNNDWFVAAYKNEDEIKSGRRVVHIIIKEDDWNFVTGHVIDGRNLFPAAGYLILVWETLAMMFGKLMTDMKVVFEDVRFIRAINLPKQGGVELVTVIQTGDKIFEITEGGTTVVTGKISELEATDQGITELPVPANEVGKNAPSLNQKDIYKELRIRGYNYGGLFRGLKECNANATKGSLAWNGNWITFMDNMLQMKILQADTKSLYVPTGIQQVIIDGHKHISYCSKLGEKETIVPIYLYKETDIIRSGGVEIHGVNVSPIPRKKYGIPVLEVYKFLPNEISLPVAQSVRIMVQIILENNMTIKVKSVEQPDPTMSEVDLLSPLIQQALGDMPLIQAEIIVLTKNPLDLQGITVEDRKLNSETNSLLAVVSKAFQRNELLDAVLNIVKDTNGYIITREDVNFDISTVAHHDLDILCVHKVEAETLILLKKSTKLKQATAIDISDSLNNLHWLPTVQNAVKNDQNLILYSQNRFINGILGLVNCLRREHNGCKISCFFIIDDAPKFDMNHPFYRDQAQKNLGINVWKDSKWGTYRHLLLEKSSSVQSEHCYVDVTVRGDLSSLRWTEGSLTKNIVVEPENELVSVYCSALNFRDIMIASGRISNALTASNRIEPECFQGFEFSGRDASGKRVMGMVQAGALSSLVLADLPLLWPIPDEWSMEDAATVPVAYATVIYGLITRANIKHGQSILIHSATGGVGQAAINVALYFGCNIFVTVGTQEKRVFLRKNYPQIEESHIGNSRDLSFEQMVQTETKERGVDIVLNSLAEEKLIASVRCLAQGGQFLEIGKFDMVNDKRLGMQMFAKNITFCGIMLDSVLVGEPAMKRELACYVTDLIKRGAVKPLPRTVFKRDEVIQAYKYMVTGKHMGKVLINVRQEENEKICEVPREIFEGIPRYFCHPDSTYIIVGGLGGFGLQLADWLVIRGARKIILTSRTGIKTGYQAMMINLWRRYGSEIVVRTDDVTSKEGCLELIEYANSLGPVKAIFNLAVVLKDALFENQTAENYQTSLAPKAIATQHLDAVTREKCPQLSHFVIFSSVSCGRGNAGQTNYGMANSIMERICESRKADGYPALAIQWGAIGDVGLVADMQESNRELVIGGTLQQKISSCLQVLDSFLRQNEPIVGSMVVAEKRSSSSSNNIVDAVVNIIGIGDLKNVSLHSTFPELGMDSMMAEEVKQTLEREYEVFLSAQDIRTMTFARLKEIAAEKMVDASSTATLFPEKVGVSEDVKLLLYHVGDEASAKVPVVRMNTLVNKAANAIKVFVLPGIEGNSVSMEPLVKDLNVHAACLQYCVDSDVHTLEEWAKAVFPYVEAKPSNFVLVAHSFGCAVAIELTRLLEASGRYGKVIFIDGSPGLMAEMIKKQFEIENEELFQTSVICAYMTRYLPFGTIMKHKADILKCPTLEDRVKYGLSMSPKVDQSHEYVEAQCIQGYRKMKACINYTPDFDKLKSEIKLIKPKHPTVLGYSEDYGLSQFFEKPVDIVTFEGNHLTILENTDVAKEVNRFINAEEIVATNFVNGIDAKIFGDIRQVQSHE